MSISTAVWILILIALVAANLPWLSERVFFVWSPKSGVKRVWQRWLEWLALYVLVAAVAAGLELRMTDEVFSQDWEFYVVTVCLFLVLALPGFIYRYDLRHHLARG